MSVRDEIANLEDVIVATLLRNPALVLSEVVDVALFNRWKHVIQAMIVLAGKGIEPDIFMICEHLGENDLFQQLGFLMKDQPGVAANYKHFLDLHKSKVTDLTIFERLRGGMKQIADGSPSSKVLGEIIAESLRIFSESTARQYSFTAKEMMQVMIDKLESIHEQPEGVLGVQTGIWKLDSLMGAMHKSDLCVVGARPSVGKTAYGITVMLNAAKQGKRVGFISTEMPIDQIAFRVSSQLSRIEATKFRKAKFDDDEWTRISASTLLAKDLSIRICDKTVMTVSDVAIQCRAWDLDGGLDLVVIDYLTRIKPDKSTGAQHLDVGETATQIKNIARDLKIPVILLAQLNRQSATQGNRKPRMSDLRDSGIIEQEADSILLLHREMNEDTSYSSIIIDKNRHGECAEAIVDFDGSTMRWWCPDQNEDF